jgi:ribonuclease HII
VFNWLKTRSKKDKMAGAVIGVDEAGRGCWAGPVVAAAVLTMDVETQHELKRAGVKDSKKLSEAERERLYALIKSHPRVRYAVGLRSAKSIDQSNILKATLAAMADAMADVEYLARYADVVPHAIRVDGKQVPPEYKLRAVAMVKGDDRDITIGAASIVAKVFRDRLLKVFDKLYPEYDFAGNKAYGVATHRSAIDRIGPCPIHRFSYKPLQKFKHNSS